MTRGASRSGNIGAGISCAVGVVSVAGDVVMGVSGAAGAGVGFSFFEVVLRLGLQTNCIQSVYKASAAGESPVGSVPNSSCAMMA